MQNNIANNSAAVAQSPRARTDTVTFSKKSVTLAAKTATKGEPKVEKAFDNGHGNGEDSDNSNGVSSMSLLSNNINSALESYKDVQRAKEEIDHGL